MQALLKHAQCLSRSLYVRDQCIEMDVCPNRQDEMETTAWRIKIQDDQDLRVARMVDLYDDLQDPFDPL